MLQFGPDGDLYVGVGDGGANPPTIPVGVYGQTLDDLLGSILRIDPRMATPTQSPRTTRSSSGPGPPRDRRLRAAQPVAVLDRRADKPDADRRRRRRRPRGDQPAPARRLGVDFGWPCKEGTTTPGQRRRPRLPRHGTLTPPLLRVPALQHTLLDHGRRRRPRSTPASLNGLYLWSDLCDGTVYVTDPTAARPSESSLNAEVAKPTSFGTDAKGRIYITAATGALYRIDPA